MYSDSLPVSLGCHPKTGIIEKMSAAVESPEGHDRSNPWAAWLGAVTATVFIFGPLAKDGLILLLDYVAGPRPRLVESAWGFAPSMGVPFDALLVAVFRLLPEWSRLLPIVGSAVLAVVGVARLIKRAGGIASAGAVVYLINPFVLDRMRAGHVGFLLGYALLPFILLTAYQITPENRVRKGLALGLLLSVMSFATLHMWFIGGVLLTTIALMSIRRNGTEVAAPLSFAVLAALNLFWILPLAGRLGASTPVGLMDVAVFRTRSDPTYGLTVNLLGLRGFWRSELGSGSRAWPLLLACLLLVALVGVVAGLRRKIRLAIPLAASAVIAFFLALGDQGPTGSVFLFLFDHLPGFKIMREPQKFLAIVALAYAFFYGLGAQWFLDGLKQRWQRVVLVALLIALPCAYSSKMFWGFNGQVKPSRFPASWEQADALMGVGPERVLALPWHLYLAFPWTQNRVVANPAPSFFRRDVIAGDNIEAGKLRTQSDDPRSKYLEYILARPASTPHFGNLVAPLGIKYVLLMKVHDWSFYATMYNKADMRLVLDTPDLAVFENTEPVSLVYAPAAEWRARDLEAVIRASEHVRLTDYAITLDENAPTTLPPRADPPQLAFRRTSPVRYALSDSAARLLTLAEPFDKSWAVGSVHATPNLGATNAFRLGAQGLPSDASIFYTRWRLQLAGYIISGATLASLLVYLLMTRRREVGAERPAAGSEEEAPRDPAPRA